MSEIRSIDELHNHYDDIAAYCHKHQEPVFIKNDEKIDLVVMSIETYHNLTNRLELYSQLKNGMDDIAAGNTHLFSEAWIILKIVTDNLSDSDYFSQDRESVYSVSFFRYISSIAIRSKLSCARYFSL